jgi:two-component system phosphate regulon response regulator OmpR
MSEVEPHILVVDDDTRLRALLQRYLSEQGFRVTVAESAGEARRKLEALTFDLLVLDIMMPGESGLDLTQALRADSRVPILLLTAMTETEDRIEGLTRGADDYLSKPFEPRELVLRINAILRRVPQAPAAPQELSFGEFTFDISRGELKRRGTTIRLTEVETALLAALARQPGEVLSREDLRQETAEASSARTVDVQMTRLRRKIEDDPKYPRFLRTVRGSGYVLMPD